MSNRYWVGGSGDWSDSTNHWSLTSGGLPAPLIVPTSSDDVFIDSNSGFGGGGTITLTSNADFNDLSCTSGHNFTITGNYWLNCYGDMLLESGMTISTDEIDFQGSSSNNLTFNSAVIIADIYFSGDATWTLQDNLVSTAIVEFDGGIFDANDKNLTADTLRIFANFDDVSVTMGSGTWTTNSGDFNIFESGHTATVNCETSTIVVNDGSVYGSGKTLHDISLPTDAALNNDFTVHNLTFSAGKTYTFEALKTITVTGSFNAQGTVGNLITFLSDSTGEQNIISKASGIVDGDYLDITDSNVTGGASWYAGAHSFDTSNNDGWIFADAHSSVSSSVSSSRSSSISSSKSSSTSSSVSSSRSSSVSSSISSSLSISSSVSSSSSSSVSASVSSSSSSSVSSSVSSSPSEGYKVYSKTSSVSLPLNSNDLATSYTGQEVTDVSSSNNVRVSQESTGGFCLHQFKDFVEDNKCTILWEGQTNYPPSVSPVYLQVFNRVSSLWETLDSNNTASIDTDFMFRVGISNLNNYKDEDSILTCRVYQEKP